MKKDNNTPIIFVSVIIILIQIVTNTFFYLGRYIYIAFFIYIILNLPYRYKTIPTMLFAFCLGLLIDLASGSLLGLNAGAAVLIGACRLSILEQFSTLDNIERDSRPNIKSLSFVKYFLYISTMTFLFFIAYFLLEAMTFRNLGFTTLRILISGSINTNILLIFGCILQNNS
ncbi:MAG: hypothetical protein WC140_03605 [Bacteroidales bacterium]